MDESKPDPRLRARRAALVVVLVSFLAILGGLSVFMIRFESYWARMQMKKLPPPSAGFVGVANFVRSPVGLLVLATTALMFAVAVSRGRFDAWLGRLLVFFVILTLFVLVLFTAAIYLPTIGSHSISPLLD